MNVWSHFSLTLCLRERDYRSTTRNVYSVAKRDFLPIVTVLYSFSITQSYTYIACGGRLPHLVTQHFLMCNVICTIIRIRRHRFVLHYYWVGYFLFASDVYNVQPQFTAGLRFFNQIYDIYFTIRLIPPD